MRGIVSLAAALALPPGFPHRDLIVLTAFAIVLGTLSIQGLTLKPLLRRLNLHDDDPVGRELSAARERALRAALASIEHVASPAAKIIRHEFTERLAHSGLAANIDDKGHGNGALRRGALAAARDAILAMRFNDEIGDDAFHRVEEKLDRLEMAAG